MPRFESIYGVKDESHLPMTRENNTCIINFCSTVVIIPTVSQVGVCVCMCVCMILQVVHKQLMQGRFVGHHTWWVYWASSEVAPFCFQFHAH